MWKRSCVGLLALTIAAACGGPASEAPPAEAAAQPAAAGRPSYDRTVRAAQSYVDSGKADRAAEVAAQAIAQDPNRPEAHGVLGRALALQNHLEEAAQSYEKARQLGATDKRLWMELASVYDVSRRYDEAIGVYQAYLQRNPDDPEVHAELGLTFLLLDRPKEAAASLREASRLAPKDAQIGTDLGYALFKAGDADGAAAQLEGVLQRQPSATNAALMLARVRSAQGKPAEALRVLDQALAAGDPEDPEAWRLRAQLRIVTGDAAGAVADYQRLVKLNPKDAGAWIGAAGALITLNRLDEATTAVDRAEALAGPDAPPVAFRRAQLAWRRGDKAAVAVLATYAEAHKDSIEAWRELSAAAEAVKDKALAAKAKKRLAELMR